MTPAEHELFERLWLAGMSVTAILLVIALLLCVCIKVLKW